MGGAATVLVTQLPRQGQETYELIRRGGPFPYEKDVSAAQPGTLAPDQDARLLPRVHREDARITRPGSPAHRMRGTAEDTACLLYTADHYASFLKIVE